MSVQGQQIKKSNDERLLRWQLDHQRRLNDITEKIHSANDTDDILINLQEDILGLFDSDRITIYVVEANGKQIVSRLKTGSEVSEIRVPINEDSISGYCAKYRKVVNVLNVYNETEVKGINSKLNFDKRWDRRTGYRTIQVLAAPILYSDGLLGVVQLVNKKGGRRFTKGDETSLAYISNVLGIAFHKNRLAAGRAGPTRFDFLVAHNIIGATELSTAMAEARKKKIPVESVLIETYGVSRADIGKALSSYYKARFISIDPATPISRRLLTGLKPDYLRRNGFVPVARSGDTLVVAMENPNHLPARDAIRKSLPARRYEYCVALAEDIRRVLDSHFENRGDKTPNVPGSIDHIIGLLRPEGDDMEGELDKVSEEDSAVVQLVSKMIHDAYQRKASDIHIEPGQGKADATIRFRIDGDCRVYRTVPYTHKRAVASRIKIMSDLDIAERRLPQDGKIKFRRFSPLDLELRVATVPTAGGNEDVVLRLLPGGKPMALAQMGMNERDYKRFMEMIQKPYGMILVVGPTGSGKTTTLHAALSVVNQPETKIWTAEDPVEITQEGLRQAEVKPRIGFNFARAMRAFLRADPDIIMIGEMRDGETAGIGIEASLTGHLVFSTLHTNSAPETVTRLLDMGMDPFNFGDSLLGVLAQRLVRRLCPRCKEKYHPDLSEFEALVRAYDGNFDELGVTYSDEFFLYRKRGCPECGQSGYRGRNGIHELLVSTDQVKSLIQSGSKTDEIRSQAVKDGMTTLMQNGIRKVCEGMTDMRQVRRVSIR
ncbi:MAG: GspE/PulE family protein [Deltaproteobacteria bacterium]|nr:GspE/PulE family protein [Deltaproteobacteria bacterium]